MQNLQNKPVEEILDNIKAVINDNHDEVLELTDVYNNEKEERIASEKNINSKSTILERIDAMVKDNDIETEGVEDNMTENDEENRQTKTVLVKKNKKPLLSKKSEEISKKAMQELADAISPKIDSISLAGGKTIEDIVRESLTPLLAEWLDKNLPVIVEKLVQKEIRNLMPSE